MIKCGKLEDNILLTTLNSVKVNGHISMSLFIFYFFTFNLISNVNIIVKSQLISVVYTGD